MAWAPPEAGADSGGSRKLCGPQRGPACVPAPSCAQPRPSLSCPTCWLRRLGPISKQLWASITLMTGGLDTPPGLRLQKASDRTCEHFLNYAWRRKTVSWGRHREIGSTDPSNSDEPLTMTLTSTGPGAPNSWVVLESRQEKVPTVAL